MQWRRKGPRRRPPFDRRSNGRDPGAIADLPHLPRPRASLKKNRSNERTNERGTEGTDREKKGGIRFSKKGGKHLLFATQLSSTSSNYFLQLILARTVLETQCQPLTPTPPQSLRRNVYLIQWYLYKQQFIWTFDLHRGTFKVHELTM